MKYFTCLLERSFSEKRPIMLYNKYAVISNFVIKMYRKKMTRISIMPSLIHMQ